MPRPVSAACGSEAKGFFCCAAKPAEIRNSSTISRFIISPLPVKIFLLSANHEDTLRTKYRGWIGIPKHLQKVLYNTRGQSPDLIRRERIKVDIHQFT